MRDPVDKKLDHRKSPDENFLEYVIRLWRMFRGEPHHRFARTLVYVGFALLSPTALELVFALFRFAQTGESPESVISDVILLPTQIIGSGCIVLGVTVFGIFQWRATANRGSDLVVPDDDAIKRSLESMGFKSTVINEIMMSVQKMSNKVEKVTQIERSIRHLMLFGVEPNHQTRDSANFTRSKQGSNTMDEDQGESIFVRAAELSLRELDFGAAHREYRQALKEATASGSSINGLRANYLQTGLVYYGITNNMVALESLVDEFKEPSEILEDESSFLFADVLQEIGTRDTANAKIVRALRLLERHYSDTDLTSLQANSIGLAYRRYGERGHPNYLKAAEDILRRGLSREESLSYLRADILNNLGITLIRAYEESADVMKLAESQSTLEEGLSIAEKLKDVRTFMLIPKLLNNLGNCSKQKAILEDSQSEALRAMDYYSKASSIWTQDTAPYEWAMTIKNRAQVKTYLSKQSGNAELALEAIDDCELSMRYRDLDQSPRQWTKSAQVLFEAALVAMQITQELSPKVRKYVRIVESRCEIWKGTEFDYFRDLVRKLSGGSGS